MSALRTAFVVRIQCDDADAGRAIARALVEPLGARGARVTLDGSLQESGDAYSVSITTSARGLPGATATVGVRDADETRWLVPLPIPDEPQQAADEIIGFLARWGFIATVAQPRLSAA